MDAHDSIDNPKRLLLTGATGFIGNRLRERLLRQGHLLTVVTRNPARHKADRADNQRFVSWDAAELAEAMGRTDAVIHLAGENVAGGRWTTERRNAIHSSRVETTARLVRAMAAAERRPECFVSASAVGIYGDRGEERLDEQSTPGTGFLSVVCRDWEAEARKAESLGVRVAIPRIGVVLGREGGILQRMWLPFTFGVGGPVGSADLYLPWIHKEDVCRGLEFPLEHPEFAGVYNLCAPEPVRMGEFASTLGRVMNRPSLFTVPTFVLRLVLGEGAQAVTASLRVVPEVLRRAGFAFEFEDLESALGDLC